MTFLFLPERLEEFDLIQESYPDGDFKEFKDDSGAFLFAVYEVTPVEE